MPYRAPELFDVKTGALLDEKVDIWVRKCLSHSGPSALKFPSGSFSLLAAHSMR